MRHYSCQAEHTEGTKAMTISELIQTLETIRAEYGNVVLGQVDLFDGEDLILDYYDENDEGHTVRVKE